MNRQTFIETVTTAATLEDVHAAEAAYAQTPAGWNAGKLSIRKTAIQALRGTVPARGVRDTDAQYAAALNQALTAAFNARQKAAAK